MSLQKGATMRTQQTAVMNCRRCNEPTYLTASPEQFAEYALPRGERRLVQEIFPDFSIGDRELLISGTCNTCWQELFGSDEGDDTDIYTEKEEQA